MRIVAWNCAKALHKKFDPLLALRPDIAVISECAEPAVLERKCDLPAFSAPPVWSGGNPNWRPENGPDPWLHSGLGVFFFNGAAGHIHGRFNYMPHSWTEWDFSLDVGSFEDWTGAGLSDHAPLTLDIPAT